MLNAQHFLELNVVEPAEADIVEDQQDLPTLSSEDMMKLGLIAQVKEDHSPLPPNRKRLLQYELNCKFSYRLFKQDKRRLIGSFHLKQKPI